MPIDHDWVLYRERNIVERAIGWLKQSRRIATRYKKDGQPAIWVLSCSPQLVIGCVTRLLMSTDLRAIEKLRVRKGGFGVNRSSGTVRGHPSLVRLSRLGGFRCHYRLRRLPDDPSCGNYGQLGADRVLWLSNVIHLMSM